VPYDATEKFAKKLLGDSEIETILRRLDRLTEDEARMAVAQTMGVVYGLVGNIKIVMEGVFRYLSAVYFLRICLCVRWQSVYGEYSTGFGYVSHAK
jgi:hypothetical protein